jgi:hypothetical protein
MDKTEIHLIGRHRIAAFGVSHKVARSSPDGVWEDRSEPCCMNCYDVCHTGAAKVAASLEQAVAVSNSAVPQAVVMG